MDNKIYVAFRFHANLYHSYRADTMDEKGIGKDVRIMRYCLDTLDRVNKEGINAKGTWDIENYYSLQNNMKKFCPDIIERIKKRVQNDMDEVEIMSYDNGIITAHTKEEAEIDIKYAIENDEKSGLKDIFGRYAPIIRPQENMMTPSLIEIYNKLGIEAISTYYSAIPFNCFGSFVPELSVLERFNPLWYTAEGFGKIKVLPAINPGDIMDKFGLCNYIHYLRNEQLKFKKPHDILLLLDMDADDDFWHGYANVKLSKLFNKTLSLNCGLYRYIQLLNKFDYIEFCTPYEYLKTHDVVGTVSVSQDTADGAYDSYCSWADKLENTKLWTCYDMSRQKTAYAKSISDNREIKDDIFKSLKQKILVSSTTHFGLSTPVMCKPRLLQAFDKAEKVNRSAEDILQKAEKLYPLKDNENLVVFNKDYINRDINQCGMIRIKTDKDYVCDNINLSVRRTCFGVSELDLIYNGQPKNIYLKDGCFDNKDVVNVTPTSISNGTLSLKIDNKTLCLYKNDKLITDSGSFETIVVYDYNEAEEIEKIFEIDDYKNYATITLSGKLKLNNDAGVVAYNKVFTLIANLPYLICDVDISYPKTTDFNVNKEKAKALYRTYDMRWQEVRPIEIIPNFKGRAEDCIKVYKHNFMGSRTNFNLDYYKYTKNQNIDSANNAITCGYISFANSKNGLLISQSSLADNNFAFMKTRFKRENDIDTLYLNPQGVYVGKQLKYNTSRFGFGTLIAKTSGEGYLSSAPTFRNGRQQFSLMIAPYDGGAPNDSLVNDALMFAFPPYIYSKDGSASQADRTDYMNFEKFS